MTSVSQQESSDQPEIQSMTGLFEEVLREFSALGDETEPLQVELVTSEIMGEWWEDGDDLGSPELIAFAAAEAEAGGAGLLAALRVLAATEEQRQAAADAFDGLSGPEWAAKLGQATVRECWRTADVYGDESSLLCVFGEGEAAHGVLALLDFAEFGGWVRDVVIVDSPDEVLADMHKRAEDGSGLVTIEQVSPGRAHQLLADGFSGTDSFAEPAVTEDFVRFRALAIARCRALPAPEPLDPPKVVSPAERDEIVAEFVQASEDVEDTPALRACARLLVDFGCEHDPRRPLRVGPERLGSFLDSIADGEIEIDEEQEEILPWLLSAWARWGASRDGLPEVAVTALLEAVDECLEQFRLDMADESTVDVYLGDGEEYDEEVLARRMFAIPSPDTEIGDEELELDPTDPEQRRLLVIGEHPEYHDSLDDDDFDEDARMHLAVKTALVDQLWDNEPPEVWQAAQRLLDKGLARAEVLDELGRVLAELLEPEAEDRLEFDLDDYREALAELA